MVLKGAEPITCRPGELLSPIDFNAAEEKLKSKTMHEPSRRAISWCLYPKVIEDFLEHREEYADISQMETHVFFMGMRPAK